MHTVIIGGSGGIGQALVKKALSEGHRVTATTRQQLQNKQRDDLYQHSNLTWYALDVLKDEQVKTFCEQLGDVDRVINCIGLLHNTENHKAQSIQPEKSLRTIDADVFTQVMQVNVLPTLLLAKHLKSNLKHSQHAIFATISARVGSIADNRSGGWYSYRASKAALNMCLKNISLEWQRSLKNVCVASLHPGTTDTGLSKPFQKNVPAHKLFSPEQTAAYLWDVMEQLTPEQTGKFWAWDGQEIEW